VPLHVLRTASFWKLRSVLGTLKADSQAPSPAVRWKLRSARCVSVYLFGALGTPVAVFVFAVRFLIIARITFDSGDSSGILHVDLSGVTSCWGYVVGRRILLGVNRLEHVAEELLFGIFRPGSFVRAMGFAQDLSIVFCVCEFALGICRSMRLRFCAWKVGWGLCLGCFACSWVEPGCWLCAGKR